MKKLFILLIAISLLVGGCATQKKSQFKNSCGIIMVG
jgi:hypothetical protein